MGGWLDMITEAGWAFIALVGIGGGVITSSLVDWLFYPIRAPMGWRDRLAWLVGGSLVFAFGTWFVFGIILAIFSAM
jgi:hypothetical protein